MWLCVYIEWYERHSPSPPILRVRMLFHLLFAKCAPPCYHSTQLDDDAIRPTFHPLSIHLSIHACTSSDADAAVTATHLHARVKIAFQKKMYNFHFVFTASSSCHSRLRVGNFCIVHLLDAMQTTRREYTHTARKRENNGNDDEKKREEKKIVNSNKNDGKRTTRFRTAHTDSHIFAYISYFTLCSIS